MTNPISIQVKTPKGSSTAIVNPSCSVLELKQILSQQYNCSPSQCCIISHGKIMKDPETLELYGIKNDSVVHLIIKAADKKKPSYEAKLQASASTSTPEIKTPVNTPDSASNNNNVSLSNNPLNSGPLPPPSGPSVFPMANLQNVLSDPNSSRPLMEMASKLLNNISPDQMNSMLSSHPSLSKFLESNPEFKSQFTPSNIKKMLEIFSNPVMAEEFMRNQNQAIQALQNMPGGARHLDQIMKQFSNVDPSPNAYEYKPNTNSSSVNQRARPNRESDHSRPNLGSVPIPNPWGNNDQPENSSLAPNPESDSLFNIDSMDGPTEFTPEQDAYFRRLVESAVEETIASQGADWLNSFGADDQSQSNNQPPPPSLNNVNFESILNSLTSNMNINNQSENPTLPDLNILNSDSFRNLMTPENIQAFSNPRVADAIVKIRHYMEILRTEAPGLFQNLIPSGYFRLPNVNTGINNIPSTQNSTTANPNPAPSQPPINLREKFSHQLDLMKNMGFLDETKCLRALEVSNGDVSLAIEWLISNNLQ